MRLPAVVLASLLFAPLLVAAQEASPDASRPMGSYRDYMGWCIGDMAQSAQKKAIKLNESVVAAVLVQCQCEYERLPALNEPVNVSLINGATKACWTELEGPGGEDGFARKYAQHLRLDELKDL